MGERREYMVDGEIDVVFGTPYALAKAAGIIPTTHSYFNAPPIVTETSLPTVIYQTGLGGWTSENTALLEEIASHGYAVFALGSPGLVRGLMYPNGETVRLAYPKFREYDPAPDPLAEPLSDDLQVRYDLWKSHLSQGQETTCWQ